MATNGEDSESSRPGDWGAWVLLILLTAFAASLVFIPSGSMPWPDCLIYKHCGLHCPGCGGTRAAKSLAAGDWQAAMKLNIMIFPILIGSAWTALAFVVNRLTGRTWWSPAKLGVRTMCVLLVILLVFTVIRNLEFGSFLRP